MEAQVEDMSNSEGGGRCVRCCGSFIVTSCLAAFFLWLSLRATNPVCSIQEFFVPALNKSSNSIANHSIYIDLKLSNPNQDQGIHYHALNLTLRYFTNATNAVHLANYTLPGFYQGHGKTTHRSNLTSTSGLFVNGSAPAVFRIDLATAVRFKIMFWNTKKHKLVVGANVEVNDRGQKANKKGITLKSGAPENLLYGGLWSISVLLLVHYR